MAKGNGLHKYTVQEARNVQLGQAGYIGVATGAHTGAAVEGVEYVAITSLHDNTEVTTTSFDSTLYPTITSLVVPKGITIYGRWSEIDVSSGGGIVAYIGD